MTQQEMIQFFNTPPSFWYQKIKIGDVWTPGRNDTDEKWNKLIIKDSPFDPAGKSVLDIGCNAGAYLYKYAEAGAEHTHGVETDSIFLSQARFVLAEKRKYREYNITLSNILPSSMPVFDVAVAFNTMYWVGWNTELSEGNPEGCSEYCHKILDGYLQYISTITKFFYVIGSDSVIPGRIEKKQSVAMTNIPNTIKYLEPYFEILSATEDSSLNRNHNKVWCKSKWFSTNTTQ